MIFDCFTFFNELDLLELRLELLDSVVDRFIIVEANKTHSGLEKPYYFEENRTRFSAYENKIIYVKLDTLPQAEDSWILENLQRNHIAEAVKQYAKSGDTILLSDIDEIPRPELVAKYAGAAGMTTFYIDYYCFYLNARNVMEYYWPGTKLLSYEAFFSIADNVKVEYNRFMLEEYNQGTTPTKLRCARELPTRKLRHAGWHFTSIGGAAAVLQKLKSYAHQEFNVEGVTEQSIEKLIAEGKTPFDWQRFYCVPIDKTLPKCIQENPEKYSKYIFNVTPDYIKRTRWPRFCAKLKHGSYCFLVEHLPLWLVRLVRDLHKIISKK